MHDIISLNLALLGNWGGYRKTKRTTVPGNHQGYYWVPTRAVLHRVPDWGHGAREHSPAQTQWGTSENSSPNHPGASRGDKPRKRSLTRRRHPRGAAHHQRFSEWKFAVRKNPNLGIFCLQVINIAQKTLGALFGRKRLVFGHILHIINLGAWAHKYTRPAWRLGKCQQITRNLG